MRDNEDEKYEVKGNVEELKQDIKNLTREFADISKGKASQPDVPTREKVEDGQAAVPEEAPAAEPAPEPVAVPPSYDFSQHEEPFRLVNIFKSRALYVVVAILLALFFLGRFLYTCNFSTFTSEITDIEIKVPIEHKVYYNVFGQVKEEEISIGSGKEKIVMPITLQRWMHMDKESKYREMKRYQEEAFRQQQGK